MVKKSLAAMAVVGALAVPTVAQAAQAAPAAPSSAAVADVRLAWAGAGKVRISWTEPAGRENSIFLKTAGQTERIGVTSATAPNELIVPISALKPSHDPASTARIYVEDPSTAGASSAAFDRYVRGETALAPMMTAGALQWQFAPDTATDTTPNDPLDVSDPGRIQPRLLRSDAGRCESVSLPATTGLSGTVPRQPGAYTADLVLANEWGESKLASVRVRTSSTTFSTPAAGVYGGRLTMSGAISLQELAHTGPGECTLPPGMNGLGGREMVLHGRNSATSPWYVIGVAKTDAQGKYTFVIANTGAREYRAVLKESAGAGLANYQSISTPKVTRAIPQVIEARFVEPEIALGQQPNATVVVAPYGSHQVALQFKNASGQWQGLMYRTLVGGGAESGPFAFNRVGTHQFRWWVAASTGSTGLPVDAGYTYPFTLTVR
ncbi:hypothetical protein FB561_6754 [Kribbella amoyensis]|uniref:Ig-like domain-containing protein n=1 Tax=Kribbella amoyensis TaxID=996641 RepID=A0A561B8M7_9ACTN|nr:hypothetical protein [Kribbella amoyensis]TWD75316.1 hypothetical protein FB561_6754 [Kribbella amoyensis]